MKTVNPYSEGTQIQDGIIESELGRIQRMAWQKGFDASTKYWNEPCTEHPVIVRFNSKDCYQHRFLCPECRKESQC